MSSVSRRSGFTLIEVLVAIALLGMGVSVGLGAISVMNQSEARVFERERMQRLAVEKYDEMVATGEYETSPGGDFEDRGEPELVWSVEIEPTGIENLDAVTVTVNPEGREESEATATGLIYRPPVETEAP